MLNVNAPLILTLAFLPNKNPFGFKRYKLALSMLDLIIPSILGALLPVTLPKILLMKWGPLNVIDCPFFRLNSVKL